MAKSDYLLNAENWLGPGGRQTKWAAGCCKKSCEVLCKETRNVMRNVTRKGDQININKSYSSSDPEVVSYVFDKP